MPAGFCSTMSVRQSPVSCARASRWMKSKTFTRKPSWRCSRRAHTYEPGRPLEPWLFAIARNVAADHSRRRWSRASWEELTADLPERAEGDSPAPAPDIEGLLTRLPPAQREAFAMLKLEAMTLEAAAGRAGVSVGALKVRAHRAYKTLRKLIGGEGE